MSTTLSTKAPPRARKKPSFSPGRASNSIRVLLIQPPPTGCVRSLLPQLDGDASALGNKPPIGLLSIASTIKAMSDHEVMLIDALPHRLSFDQIVERAEGFSPALIGITAWTDMWWPAHEIGKRLKNALPEVIICYGGPHVNIYPQQTLEASFVDAVVMGDGERPFLAMANLIADGKILDGIPGLFTKNSVFPEKEKDRFFIDTDLDSLPVVDRTLLDPRDYSSILGGNSLVTTMITSRGCPGKCVYCKLHFQKTISRSAESVLEEFRRIQALGIEEVEIYDDTFTWSQQRVRDICEGIISEGIRVKWAVRDRVDRADRDLLFLMKRAGCVRVHYGVESGVDTVLREMRKNITTNQVRQAVAWAKEAGMIVLTYYMFGNLKETVAEMRRTIDFALELDTNFAEFSITIPYPGTKLYSMALEKGVIDYDYWALFAQNPVPDFSPPKVIENLADLATLIKLRDEAIRRFYFRPRYLARQIMALRSWRELKAKGKMGLHLANGLVHGLLCRKT